jgi:RNA polymerase sigma factor (TIGR02999 family)
MSDSAPGTVTLWLQHWREGDSRALEHIVPLVYDELRRVARHQVSHERDDITLSPTGLVHEAYLRLLSRKQLVGHDRSAFLAVAAQTMRRILVEHARRRTRMKRGGGQHVEAMPDDGLAALAPDVEPEEVVATDLALARLAEMDDRAARVVECRIFGGLTLAETAEALDISTRTVQRTWTAALAWLRKEVADDAGA